MCPSWQYPSKHDGTNTVPHLYHFLPVCTGSTGYRSTVQKRYCFSIDFHYWPVPFIRYWTIPFSYKHPIQRHNCTSVLVHFAVKTKFCMYCQQQQHYNDHSVPFQYHVPGIRYRNSTSFYRTTVLERYRPVPLCLLGCSQVYMYLSWQYVVRYTCAPPGNM